MKGILVVDMPEHCNDCAFRTGDNRGNYWCHALLPRLKLGTIDGMIPRHIKCPLKPMPSKYELTTEKGNRYAVGWNDCIDEILGEEE